MITQEIQKYKEEYSHNGGQWPNYNHHGGNYKPPHIETPVVRVINGPFAKLDKLSYAKYIDALPFKKGDLICLKQALKPLTNYQIYELEDIQEIWYLADFAGPEAGPLCLRLRAYNGNRFNGGGNQYVKVPPDELTASWRTFLQQRWSEGVIDV